MGIPSGKVSRLPVVSLDYCLTNEAVNMAKEMNPKSLIKKIPSSVQQGKDPVEEWVRDMYDKRQEKARKKVERKGKY